MSNSSSLNSLSSSSLSSLSSSSSTSTSTIDLRTVEKSKKTTTDDLIAECEARGITLPPKRSSNEVKKSGKDSDGNKIDKAYFVGLLKANHPGVDVVMRQSDVRSQAQAWGDDADGGGGSDDEGPVMPL